MQVISTYDVYTLSRRWAKVRAKAVVGKDAGTQTKKTYLCPTDSQFLATLGRTVVRENLEGWTEALDFAFPID